MRRLVAAVALLLATLAGPAAAHGGEEFPHVNPLDVRLAPGASRDVELTFTEMGTMPRPNGTFGAGWVFVLNALVHDGSAPVEAALRPGHLGGLGAPAASWNLTAPGLHRVTGPMPVEDVYTLTFRNTGASNASLTFFYDQSCNCAGKPIPEEVAGGLVVFNVDTRDGFRYGATILEPPAHEVKVTMATRTDERSRWPEDFRPLQSSSQATVANVGRGPVKQHLFNWTSEGDERYYFFAESVRFDPAKVNRSSPPAFLSSLMLGAAFDEQAPEKRSPLGPEVALLGLGAALLVARRRR